MTKHPQSAFTLIELSIALVIIGLLAGGILFGRDMLRAAELRRQISQIEKFNTATNTFKTKYNCLPGDCANAEDLGLGTAGGAGENGNNDGLVNNDSVTISGLNWLGLGEALNFWYHLSVAELIAERMPGDNVTISTGANNQLLPGIATPPLAMSGTAPVTNTFHNYNSTGGIAVLPLRGLLGHANYSTLFEQNDKNAWFLINTLSVSIGMNSQGVYYAPDLYALDIKIDDGLPRQGRMRVVSSGFTAFWDTPGLGQPTTASCTTAQPCCINPDTSPWSYNLTVTSGTASMRNAACAPVILTQF